MTSLLAVGYALSVAVTALAWFVTRKRPEHRPIAWLLTVGLGTDVLRRVLSVTALAVPGPYRGGARFAFHVDQTMFLAWPAAISAAAIVIFLRRKPYAVAFVWAAAVAVLSLSYPTVRGALLARCYVVLELAALVVGIGAALTWVREQKFPELPHVCVALVIGVEAVSAIAGPWKANLFGSWPLAQSAYVLLYAVLLLLQGGSLWTAHSSSSS